MAYRYDISPIKTITDPLSKNVGEKYYANNVYPDIPLSEGDVYVVTTYGDRLDLLAYDYYGDSSMWWIIASANSLPGDSMYPPMGEQIRIPADPLGDYMVYKSFNVNR